MLKSTGILAAVLAIALASPGALAQENRGPGEPPPAACDGQRFIFHAGAPPNATRVTLCSKKDPTPDELVRMFESAAAALAKNDKLAPERRTELIAQIRSKADEFRGAPRIASAGPATVGAIAKPVQPAPTAPAAALPTPARPTERMPEYATLPPLPPPLPVASSSVAASPAAAVPAPVVKAPRLTIRCAFGLDLAEERCTYIQRDTLLVVRADEDVPALMLRFMRRGSNRGEIALPQMRAGQSVNLRLPSELCKGVITSKGEIEIVRRGTNGADQVTDRVEPFSLRC